MNRETQFHIGLTKENSARYAILPGDPGRVEKIAKQLDSPAFIAQNREFTTYSGYLSGERVLITSTGIGGPSAAIALEELSHVGVDTVIRVGTCGGMQKNVKSGDLIIATSAVRMDGTSAEYVPIEFPAAADFNMTQALVTAAKKDGVSFHTGTVQSKDSFYSQHSPHSMPVSYELINKWNAWQEAGVLASEMECSTLFTVSAVRRIRAGAVLTAIWNQENEETNSTKIPDSLQAIKTAVNALEQIIMQDRAKSSSAI